MSDYLEYDAPLYKALLQYKNARLASFHVPGHKNGQAYRIIQGLKTELDRVMEIDVTEITGTDDLHQPMGVIKEAQQRAAVLFGAEETFFLVGGSTAGNLAMILSVCTAPGDVLLVQRNVHKSVIHGLMLAGAHAVFLAPQIAGATGLPTIPSPATVREALQRHPDAKGLLVTHPNYYGMGTSLTELAELCHAVDVPLLVDEAHGAHYGLHPALPQGALAQGADGVVQSTHKMLAALTMGAMLHVQGERINRSLLRQRLAMLQSSSPSYPIMASLDLSRSVLARHGEAVFAEGLKAAEWLRRHIAEDGRFAILEPGDRPDTFAYTIQDPFKLVIYDIKGQLSGYELQVELEAEGCIPEMSDDRYVVLALSGGTLAEDALRLRKALQSIAARNHGMKEANHRIVGNRPIENYQKLNSEASRPVFTWNNLNSTSEIELISKPIPFDMRPVPPEAVEAVSLEECYGRTSAEMIIPYPPGIPLLYPGEMISEKVRQRLKDLHRTKAKVQGAADSTIATILVYQNEVAADTKVITDNN